MKALITGASQGIGKDMAIILSSIGYDIVVVARDEQKLKSSFSGVQNCQVIAYDLSNIENCKSLYNDLKDEDIDVVINNAGIGIFGEVSETDLQKELAMIDLNIKAVHILTKLFLQDMVKKNRGYILNVASIGAFVRSPLFASYYATKSYVLSFSDGINQELRAKKSNVYVGAYCPGTVETDFHKNAGAMGDVGGVNSLDSSRYAITKMFKKKPIITYGLAGLLPFFIKISPVWIVRKVLYNIQKNKE